MIRSIAVETSPPPPMSTLFPYTTLFRSLGVANLELLALEVDRRARRRQPRRAGRGGRLVALRWAGGEAARCVGQQDRKSTRLNSSHRTMSYADFCWKNKVLRTLTRTRKR